jgi:hypothetical protein
MQRRRRLDHGALALGVRSIAIGWAVSEMEGWRRKLEASGDPDLQPIACNLVELERALAADEPVAATTGTIAYGAWGPHRGGGERDRDPL